MALSDFNIYRQHASITFAIDTVSPILGGGALRLASFASGQRANAIRNVAPNQFTSGRARWLCVKRTNPGASSDRLGVLFNTSQEDFSVGSGPTAYLACLVLTSTTTARFQLVRVNNGLPSLTDLTPSTQNFSLAVNTVVAVEVRWELSLANFNGFQFRLRRGSATDFSDLVDEPGGTVVVTTNLLQTTVGEGPAIVAAASSPGDYRIDQMQVVPLILGG